MNLYLTLIRMFFRILSKVAPQLAGSFAFHLFQTPRTRAIRSIEKPLLMTPGNSHSLIIVTVLSPTSPDWKIKLKK